MLRTRLALRDAGWHECEELIWLQDECPAAGEQAATPRAWESILWYGKCPQPYCDLKACGKPSKELGFDGSIKFADQGVSEKTGWHPCVASYGYGERGRPDLGRDPRTGRERRAPAWTTLRCSP